MLSFLPLVCGSYAHSEFDGQAIFDGQAESARQTFVGEQAGQTIRWSQRFSSERGEGESGGPQRGGPSRWEAPPTTAASDSFDYRLAFTAIRVPALLIDAGSSLLVLTLLPPASLLASDVAPAAPAIPDAVAIDASLDGPPSPSPSPVTIPPPLLDTPILERPQRGEFVSIDPDDSRLVTALPYSMLTPPATRLVASTLPAFDEAVSFIEPLWLASTDALFRLGWHLEDALIDDPAGLLAAPRGETRQVSRFQDSEVATGHLSFVTHHDEARPGSSDEALDAWFARTHDPLDQDSEPAIELAISRELDARDFRRPDFAAVGDGGQIGATRGVEYLRAEDGRAVYQVMDIAVAVEEAVDGDLMTTAGPAPQADTEGAPVEAAAVQDAPASLEAAPPDAPTTPLTKAILLPGLLAALLGRRRRSASQIVA